MADKFLVLDKIKKTNTYIENTIYNFPHIYTILKNNILELSYKANLYQDNSTKKELVIKIRILEYYIKQAFDKQLISYKKFNNIGNYLLDINKMINAWIKSETKK